MSYRNRLRVIDLIIYGGALLIGLAFAALFLWQPTIVSWGLLVLFAMTYGLRAVRQEIRMIKTNRRVRVRCGAHRLRAPYSYMKDSFVCPQGCRTSASFLMEGLHAGD